MALTDKLVAIAAAIRDKAGTSEKLTLDEMPIAIAAIEAGGGSGGEDGVPNPLIYTGDCERAFGSNQYNWLIKNYADRIQTNNIIDASYMFGDSTELEEIPFDINLNQTKDVSMNYMFTQCRKLKSIGKIKCRWYSGRSMFNSCWNLRYLPEFEVSSYDSIYTSQAFGGMFSDCYSLREIPADFLKDLGRSNLNTSTNALVYSSFQNLYTIDEIKSIPVSTPTLTSNAFDSYYSFKNCYRLKKITFRTKPDGTPLTVNWKNQTIELYKGLGWLTGKDSDITGYNSGITIDKKVVDGETYQALKNDPDWYTGDVNYSRYNHTSAVETINSLPDTSAYLATQSGGTNTIKFREDAGALTDGGRVGDLTEEEIAVATAKGWAVVYAV